MSQLSRELNAFCRENPTADTCKSIDSAMPYFSFAMMLTGLAGIVWLLFYVKERDLKGVGKIDFLKRLAFSSIPLFIALLGYQGITDPSGSSDSIYYVFLLTIPALIKYRKGFLKWIAEAYSKPNSNE